MYRKINGHLEELHRVEYFVDELELEILGICHVYYSKSKYYGFVEVQVGGPHEALLKLGPPTELRSSKSTATQGTSLHHYWLLEGDENVVVYNVEIIEEEKKS